MHVQTCLRCQTDLNCVRSRRYCNWWSGAVNLGFTVYMTFDSLGGFESRRGEWVCHWQWRGDSHFKICSKQSICCWQGNYLNSSSFWGFPAWHFFDMVNILFFTSSSLLFIVWFLVTFWVSQMTCTCFHSLGSLIPNWLPSTLIVLHFNSFVCQRMQNFKLNQ